MRRSHFVLLTCLAALGCQSIPDPPPDTPSTDRPVTAHVVVPPAAPPVEEPTSREAGVYHVVRRGQTLWRIARAYEVTVDRLVAVNSLNDASQIEVGQRVFIPGAQTLLDVCTDPSCIVADAVAVDGPGWGWPVRGRISSGYGEVRRTGIHKGIDILIPTGTPIRASRAGIVSFSGRQRGFGRVVIVDHGDGHSTLYAHNSRNLVRVGESVAQGDVVADSGQSGNASAPHLHFEIRRDGVPLDPANFLPPR